MHSKMLDIAGKFRIIYKESGNYYHIYEAYDDLFGNNYWKTVDLADKRFILALLNYAMAGAPRESKTMKF